MATFAAFPPLKLVTVVDDDVNIRDASDVEWAMATRLDAKNGMVTIDKVFGHGLNPGFPDYLGTKLGFDCTRPFPHSYEYDRAAYSEVSLGDVVISKTAPVVTDGAIDSGMVEASVSGATQHVAEGNADANATGVVAAAAKLNAVPSTAECMEYRHSHSGTVAAQGVLVILIGREGKKKYQRSALDLFIDLEERTVSSDVPFAFERTRTAAEFVATLNAYRDRFSCLVLVSGKKRGGVHFADELSPIEGQALGKLISGVCRPGSIRVVLPGPLDSIKKRSRELSKGKAITDVLAIDRRTSPDWTASLLDGFFRCLGDENRVELALKSAMPPACRVNAAIWRDGEAFTRIEN